MKKTVLLYVLSVVAANLFSAHFGPYGSILSAFAFIGATLTLRDRIHDRWSGAGLVWRMAALIGGAGVISAAISADATRIAVASFIAFAASETVDALAYHALGRRPWLVRANGSNIPSAAVDSILFPTIAFGAFFPIVTLAQFVAKVFGGAMWAWILKRARLVAALVVLGLAATPSSAQIIAANAGWIRNDAINAAAGEVYMATAPLFSEAFELRPYAIISWNTDASWEPTVLARIGHSHRFGRWQAGVGAGVIHVPGDPHFRPSISVVGFAPGWDDDRLRPYGFVALEKPFGTWDVTTFVGVTYTLWFRR